MLEIQHATQAELQLWRKRIERQRDSDLTRAEYAVEVGVDEVTWRRWERYVTGSVVSVRVVRRRKLQPITCDNARCRAEFTPLRERQRFCSDKCRAAARWMRYAAARAVPARLAEVRT